MCERHKIITLFIVILMMLLMNVSVDFSALFGGSAENRTLFLTINPDKRSV